MIKKTADFSRFAIALPGALLGMLLLAGCATVDTALTGPAAVFSCVDGSNLTVRTSASRHHAEVIYNDEGVTAFKGTLPAVDADFGERFSDARGNTLWLNQDKALLVRPGLDQALCHNQP